MKYSPLLYAKAFAGALREFPSKKDELTARLFGLLKKNGDLALAARVAEATEEILLRESGGKKVRVESARALPSHEVAKIKSAFPPNCLVEQVTRPELVAGVNVVINGEWSVDATMQRKLKNLFEAYGHEF